MTREDMLAKAREMFKSRDLLTELKQCRNKLEFMTVITKMTWWIKQGQGLIKFPLNIHSGLFVNNPPQLLHAVKLMLIYFRLDEQFNLTKQDLIDIVDTNTDYHATDISTWLQLQPVNNKLMFEYKVYPNKQGILRGCNLILLEIILAWLKLTHEPIIPDEIKIIVSK